MKKILVALPLVFFLGACATQENKIADYLKKNPKIVFDVIEENPELFIDVVNKAARKAQEAQYKKQNQDMEQQQKEQVNNPLKPDIGKDTLLFGKLDAPITIVEYADFQCPACQMGYDSLIKMKEKYGDKVQIHYKHFPLDFHKMAMPSAQYYEAIRSQDPKKAEKFYKLVFENQRELKNEDYLKKVTKQVGANLDTVQKQLSSATVSSKIQTHMDEFQKFGFTGTPVLLVNGVALHGARPLEEIEKVVAMTAK